MVHLVLSAISSLAYSKSYPFALPLILWCDKFDDHLLRCISLSNFQMVDFALLWYDLSLGQWTSITSCSDPYRTWSRHGSRGSGYTSSSIQSSQSSRSGVAWQCTRPQLLLVPRAVDFLTTRRAGRNPRVFLIVMSRFAWHLQYIHFFPQMEAFADQLCFPWRKNDYEVWHAWVFSFAEGLSCANQHFPTLEVTSE